MIGSLRGKITLRDGNHILVEVGGVGYRVLVPSSIATSGDENVFLYIYTHVKEDALDLFGFPEIADLKLFENLIGVSGVGPKTAMSIFSFSNRQQIVKAVIDADVDFFTNIPRLGKKNAQKIIIELKNKLGDSSILDLNDADSVENDEIVQALEVFGFSAKEGRTVIKKLDKDLKTTEEKIKMALKYLGQKK